LVERRQKRLLAGCLARQIHIRSFARIGLGSSDCPETTTGETAGTRCLRLSGHSPRMIPVWRGLRLCRHSPRFRSSFWGEPTGASKRAGNRPDFL